MPSPPSLRDGSPSPVSKQGRGKIPQSDAASLRKAAIFSGFFIPGASSTPDETSTVRAPVAATAPARLPILSPPASIQGSAQARPAISDQSKLTALPPGSAPFISGGGLASNSSRSATAR